jgi:translation initiation factor 4A
METTNTEKNSELIQSEEQRKILEEINEKQFKCNWNETVESFEDLNLKKDLLKGLFDYNHLKPSLMQMLTIKPMISKLDVMAQGQSVTGKTSAYITSILQNLDQQEHKCQALIIAPIRENASYIADQTKNLGLYLKITVNLFIGGTQIMKDMKKMKKGSHIVVGTPGRIRNLIKRQILNPADLKMLIIEEADEMFGPELVEQTSEIIKLIPPNCQICLFSETITPEVINFGEKNMKDPVKILVKKINPTLDNVTQYYQACSDDTNKFNNLINVFAEIDVPKCVIFVNTKKKAKWLEQTMRENGFIASCIHGSMLQKKRNSVMHAFREEESRILIATDLLRRAAGFHSVKEVINFDLPSKKEIYLNRIDRAEYFGKRTIAISFILPQEASYLKEIQEIYHLNISQLSFGLTGTD